MLQFDVAQPPSHFPRESGLRSGLRGALSARSLSASPSAILASCSPQPITMQTESQDQGQATMPRAESSGSSQRRQQRMVVLVGLVGSGKSNFANSLCSRDSPFNFVRASQDVLGSRQAVESLVMRSLSQGKNVCVDRTNVDASQRATWLRLAHQYQEQTPGVEVIVEALVFDTPLEECRRRLMARTEHETITSPEIGLRILNTFMGQFHRPTASEGFHCVASITPARLPAMPSEADIQAILDIISAAPRMLEGGTKGTSLAPVRGPPRGSRGRGGQSWGALQRGRGASGNEGRGGGAWRGQGGRGASLPSRPHAPQPYVRPPPASSSAYIFSYSGATAATSKPHSLTPTLQDHGFEIVESSQSRPPA